MKGIRFYHGIIISVLIVIKILISAYLIIQYANWQVFLGIFILFWAHNVSISREYKSYFKKYLQAVLETKKTGTKPKFNRYKK